MKRCSFIIFLLFFWPAPTNAGQQTPKERLAQSYVHFNKGDYAQALHLISDIEIRKDFDNSEDMLKAFKIKAISYSKLGNLQKSSEAIRELFYLDPEYKFDLFDTPASTVELAKIERQKIEEKNLQLAAAKSELKPLPELEPTKPAGDNVLIEKRIYIEKKPPILLSLAPFGINHIILDAPLKGSIYAATQILGLSANVGAFWFKQRYLTDWGSHQLKNSGDAINFNKAQAVQYIGLGTLILSYTISAIDALITLSKTNAGHFATDETAS